MNNQPKVYEMKLHEIISLNKWTDIRRVPGGWIYETIISNREFSENITACCTFIPFNNEFMNFEVLKPAKPSKKFN